LESFGCKLFNEFKLRQGAYFKSSVFHIDLRKKWIDSYPKASNRQKIKTVKNDSVIVLISQDCDIACKKDETETNIEFLACRKIKPKEVHPANQFVNSVRKLHFQLGDEYYEANTDYILTIPKQVFFKTLSDLEFNVEELLYAPDDVLQSFKVWRTNRYSRTALPDNFNTNLKPVTDEFIPQLTEVSLDESGKNFIRAIYVRLNSMDELDSYTFSFFALLRFDTPDDTYSDIQEVMENMCLSLAEINYTDESDNYVGRDSDTLVSDLTSYVRFNLDTHSLENGDYEPELQEL
jgi:hypothetical protein